jgi:signal transduction histidine kinase
MRARARMAGGQFSIESSKGKGTRILVMLPVAKDHDDAEKNPYSAG